MKIYDIKIGKKSGEKTFWKTIGTIFCDAGSKLYGEHGKPATFVLDFPEANGIVVKRLSKEEYEKRKADREAQNDESVSNDSDNTNDSDSNDIPY